MDDPQPIVEVYVVVRIGKQDIHDAFWFDVTDKDKEEILKKVKLTEANYGQ